VLRVYVAHYVQERPHRGLGLVVPAGNRAPQVRRTTRTRVERRDVLGGLIHEYRWAARSGLLNPSDSSSRSATAQTRRVQDDAPLRRRSPIQSEDVGQPPLETYLKVGGTWRYLVRAMDQFGQVIDVFLLPRRNREAARRLFAQAISRTWVSPTEVTTDR
jgi:hypothetical protein